jgi:hypothetical protein
MRTAKYFLAVKTIKQSRSSAADFRSSSKENNGDFVQKVPFSSSCYQREWRGVAPCFLTSPPAMASASLGLCGPTHREPDNSIAVPLLELIHRAQPTSGIDPIGINMKPTD